MKSHGVDTKKTASSFSHFSCRLHLIIPVANKFLYLLHCLAPKEIFIMRLRRLRTRRKDHSCVSGVNGKQKSEIQCNGYRFCKIHNQTSPISFSLNLTLQVGHLRLRFEICSSTHCLQCICRHRKMIHSLSL